MEVRPADIGTAWHIALFRLRVGGRQDTPAPQIGRLGKRWLRGSGLDPATAARLLPLSSAATGSSIGGMIGGFAWFPLIGLTVALGLHSPEALAVTIAGTSGLAYLGFDAIPRRIFHRLNQRPVTEREIQRLRDKLAENHPFRLNAPSDLMAFVGERLRSFLVGEPAADTAGEVSRLLEDEFLALVGEAIQTTIHSADAEAELRRTLTLLGDAVSDLPMPVGGIPEDAGDLLADAEMLVARARRESDRVIADSLLRQAEAKAAQAGAVQNALKITRRTRILRDELRAQVAATRAALPSLAMVGALPQSVTLGRVAASVQAVAREAASVQAAREELAVSLNEGWPNGSTEPVSSHWQTTREQENDIPSLRAGRR